jgi:hypothetical protein
MEINTEKWVKTFKSVNSWVQENILNIQTLIELGIIVAAFAISKITAVIINKMLKKGMVKVKEKWPALTIPVDLFMEHLGGIFFPMILFIVNGIAGVFSYHTYFVKTVATLSVVILVVHLVSHIIQNRLLSKFISYTLSAVIILRAFDIFDDVHKYLDSYAIDAGEVRVSIYFLIKGLFIFGLLIWGAGLISGGVAGRLKGSTQLTPSLKVLVSKVFNIAAYFVATLLGLSALGVNLTAFAVFGGAETRKTA